MHRPADVTTFHNFGFFQRAEGLRTYLPGEIVFAEGDPGDFMYAVIEGEVAVTLDKRLVNYLGPGTLFGEMALMDKRPRSATVTAATPCRLLPLDTARFQALIQEEPAFALQVMSIMTERLRRFMEDEVKRLRLQEELNISHQIQMSLLPKKNPQRPGWEFAATYRSAQQVGGDLYDYIPSIHDPDSLHLGIADVTGKGIPAALFMAFSRTILRAEARATNSPAEALRQANRAIVQDIDSRLFLSAFLGTLNTQTGHLRFSNGGHDRPMWYRAASGVVESLTTAGLLLGVRQDVTLPEAEIELAVNDVLVLYTDGVTEARDMRGGMFGEERLAAAIKATAHCSAQEMVTRLAAAIAHITGDTPQNDDLTLMVVKRTS
ncbi:MAG: SpoIIE family protein phosphatase [Chloroflexi bacterium]|nr:SpoIIE family protein phosphatase [Chloroflexota bacterium]